MIMVLRRKNRKLLISKIILDKSKINFRINFSRIKSYLSKDNHVTYW